MRSTKQLFPTASDIQGGHSIQQEQSVCICCSEPFHKTATAPGQRSRGEIQTDLGESYFRL
jgi:hypothetical protein